MIIKVTDSTGSSIYVGISLYAEVTVGYVQTVVTVLESNGVAQLTVGISMSPGADLIETSFFLLVNTADGTATGLLCFWSMIHVNTL